MADPRQRFPHRGLALRHLSLAHNMKFILIIDTDHLQLGHGRNVARALERVARQLDVEYPMDGGMLSKREPTKGVVRSFDGVVVGRWELDG